ncbi:hypothetical protein RDI58_019141 [Solanum bulbocastanum]|uniref:Uncharacterized protein n=2 Tax=Solanum TaxID=4107 RepID=A0AAN8THR4_SOLBU
MLYSLTKSNKHNKIVPVSNSCPKSQFFRQ